MRFGLSRQMMTKTSSIEPDAKPQGKDDDSLIARDSLFHRFFERMSDPVLLLKDGRFIDCNAATLKMLAYSSKADFLNQTPSDISPALQPDGRSSDEKAAEMIAIAVREGSHRFEWSHQRSDGLTVPIEVALTPITVDGEVVFHTLWRDIAERVRAEKELRISEAKLRTLYDSTSDAVMLLDENGFFGCNKSTLAIFGCATSEEFCAKHPADLSPAQQACGTDSRELSQKYIDTAIDKGRCIFEWLHKRADTGKTFPAEVLLSAMKVDDRPALQAVVRDITERKSAEEALRQSELHLRTVFDGALDAVITMADDGRIMGWNKQAQTIFGWAKDEAMGLMLHELITPPQYRARHQQGMARFQATGESSILNRRIEITALRRSGEEFPVEMSILPFKSADHTRFTAFIADISERNRMQEKVRQLAYFDALTDLPNRRLLDDRLNQAIAASRRSGLYGALIFLDLDNFKPINDTHGHGVGDLLLIEVAKRLSACVREVDTVARLGGDEFVVMLSELDADKALSAEQAAGVSEKIRASLATPYLLTVTQSGEQSTTVEHHCSTSIGVAMFVKHQLTQSDLMKWADAAMYQAKDAGGNAIRFYDLAQ